LRVGLLGGSFNPAHAGHRHISLMALRRLGLDQVWWLVSPQNPLKSRTDMAAFDRRLAMARLLARHPRILVTDIETRFGTRFTFDTLGALRRHYPGTRFVWLMGADNLGQIHRWQHWRGIFDTVPIAVFDRPPHHLRTLASPAALSHARHRVSQAKSRALASAKPPAWMFFPSRLEPMSSTQLRRAARTFGPDSLRTRFIDPIFRESGAPDAMPSRENDIEPQIQPTPPVQIQLGQATLGARLKSPPAKRIARAPAAANPAAGSVPALPELSPDELKAEIVRSIDDDKGEDIVVVDLEGKSAIADFIVIATGRSGRQVGAMADHLVETLQPRLSFRMAVEGLPQGDWVLIDCGDAIVHLFRPEVRDFYAIEKMWGLEPPRFSAVVAAGQGSAQGAALTVQP
jgi:nicotinate-nucleotide adenylyltransferase